MQTCSFKKKLLASAIGSCVLAGFSGVATAQGSEKLMTEEVLVTGIRGSLMRSMDIKRDSQGVVDAISAEDIGKFPDTNLAESMQRITGVSIDRNNNEGSRVTVRGFGPEFNLVTLNGRQMPTAAIWGSTRSFDFANLASEGVSGVEVHKTFSADKPTGGIGSLINIKTARPLDNPGTVASFGVKGVIDTTNENGDDITPEVSGIFSQTFADERFGVGVFFSHQQRDSRIEQAHTDSWLENVEKQEGWFPDDVNLEDRRANPNDSNSWYPRNMGFGVEDVSRTRTNGQLVLQFAPSDRLQTTLDYTYSDYEVEGLRQGIGIWFAPDGANTREAVIDESGTYTLVTEACCDYSSNQRLNTSENVNNSVGLNVNWQVTDQLNLTLDAHDSDAIAEGTGRGNDAYLILAANAIETKTMDSRTGNDVPDMHIVWNEEAVGIENGLPTAATYDSLFGQAGANVNESDITQFQLAGIWENSSTDSGLTSIDFGVDRTDITYRTRSFNTGQVPAGWYGGNQAVYDDAIFERKSTAGIVDDISGGGSNIGVPFWYDWDYEAGVAAFEEAFNDGERLAADKDGTPVHDHSINEKTSAAYLQFHLNSDFNDLPMTVVGGLRYEDTSVTANSLQIEPRAVVWVNSTEWSRTLADEQTMSDVQADYSVWLPSLDVSLELMDDVVGRLSYSRSITRPTLGDIQGTTSVTDRPKPGERTANAGNPGLKPFMSDNVDLSFEWYYQDASYASIGLFHKQVENFIVTTTTFQEIGNLRDPSQGPRAQQARAELEAEGVDPAGAALFTRINENMGVDPDSQIIQNDDDPLISWEVSAPENVETAELQGIELAIQHVFGDTGFGVQANATFVSGDIDVDVSRVGYQFVLPGLSDSANLVGFYDKHGLQARLAYNWRDEFLSATEANSPVFTEAFGQLDMNISYDLTDQFSVFVEGLNVLGENQRRYNRYRNQLREANQYGARYNIGARYTF